MQTKVNESELHAGFFTCSFLAVVTQMLQKCVTNFMIYNIYYIYKLKYKLLVQLIFPFSTLVLEQREIIYITIIHNYEIWSI